MLLAVLLLFGGCVGSSPNEDSSLKQGSGFKTLGSVTWLLSYDEALKKAKAENRDMIMYVGASSWCIYCQKMDKEVFSDKVIAGLIQDKYVPVVIDIDKRSNLKILQKYNIPGHPAFFIVNGEEKVLRTRIGYTKRDSFEEFLRGRGPSKASSSQVSKVFKVK